MEPRMNEHIQELIKKSTTVKHGVIQPREVGTVYHFDEEKFAHLLLNDMLTVISAHVLQNESALDVYKNLRRIYEGVEK
jgi:hypothetical protein